MNYQNITPPPQTDPIIPGLEEAHIASQETELEVAVVNEKKDKKPLWPNILSFGLNLAIIFFIVIVVRTYFVAPFQVSGASMTETLEDKEYIIINKFLYHGLFGFLSIKKPERGDIVVIEPPINRQIYYIKRVIGLPGETIKFEGNNVMIINNEHPEGLTLKEDYLRCVEKVGDTTVNNCNYNNLTTKEYKIPDDSYFVMGDNRNNSTDSRMCFQNCNAPNATPFVKLEHIVGKTWVVIWPLTHLRGMSSESYVSN